MYISFNIYFCNFKIKILYVGIIIWLFCFYKYLIYFIYYFYLNNEKEIIIIGI